MEEIIRPNHVPIVFADREFVNSRTGKRHTGVSFDNYLKYNFDRYLIRGVANSFDGIIVLTGLEGCIDCNTQIKTDQGNITIDSIQNNTFFNCIAFDFKKNKEVSTLAQKISTGIKEVFEVELEDGRKIICTDEHKFFIIQKNKIIECILRDIRCGGKIVSL